MKGPPVPAGTKLCATDQTTARWPNKYVKNMAVSAVHERVKADKSDREIGSTDSRNTLSTYAGRLKIVMRGLMTNARKNRKRTGRGKKAEAG